MPPVLSGGPSYPRYGRAQATLQPWPWHWIVQPGLDLVSFQSIYCMHVIYMGPTEPTKKENALCLVIRKERASSFSWWDLAPILPDRMQHCLPRSLPNGKPGKGQPSVRQEERDHLQEAGNFPFVGPKIIKGLWPLCHFTSSFTLRVWLKITSIFFSN